MRVGGHWFDDHYMFMQCFILVTVQKTLQICLSHHFSQHSLDKDIYFFICN